MLSADFFLTSAGESSILLQPRSCWKRGRLSDSVRDDYLLTKISPPLIGQPFGLGDRDISNLVLATRHKGSTLFPVTEWPASVYVARILDDSILETMRFSRNQVELVAWGTIFRTLAEAAAEAIRHSNGKI